jgi:hypothetical protein
MAVVGFLVFASALAASMAVFWLTLAPALPRIVALLRDGVDPVAPQGTARLVSEPRLRARVRTVKVVATPKWRAAA